MTTTRIARVPYLNSAPFYQGLALGERYELTDGQLRELIADPRFGPQHVQKMTPDEQQRLSAIKREGVGGSGEVGDASAAGRSGMFGTARPHR